MRYIVICLILLILPVHGAKKKFRSVYFLEPQSDYNKNYLKRLEVNISRRRDTMNVMFEIAQDLTNVWTNASVSLWQKSSKQFQSMFTYEADLCDMMSRLRSSKIQMLNKWVGNFFKYGNLSRRCPFCKNVYYFNNLKVDKDSIPGFAPNGKFQVYINPYVKKPDGSKDFITVSYLTFELK